MHNEFPYSSLIINCLQENGNTEVNYVNRITLGFSSSPWVVSRKTIFLLNLQGAVRGSVTDLHLMLTAAVAIRSASCAAR